MILKWEYRLLLSILLKVFKNSCMETNYFTKMFYLRKTSFAHKEWTKNKWIRKLKDTVKDWQPSEKIIWIKIKKKRVFYMKLVHFIQCTAYYRPFMHAIVVCMKVPFSKIVKSFPIVLYVFCRFLPFSAFSALFQPFFILFWKNRAFYLYSTRILCILMNALNVFEHFAVLGE